MIPTRADRCCYVLYEQGPLIQDRVSGQGNKRPTLDQDSACDDAVEYLFVPITGSPGHGRKVDGVVNIHVDDLFGTGNENMERRVLQNIRKDFQVGSEDWSDVAFVGQEIRWKQELPLQEPGADQGGHHSS